MGNRNTIDFGNYPFFVGVRNADEFNGVPSTLPFEIYIDPKTSLPTLQVTPEISRSLFRAYGEGSMLSTPLGIGRLATSRLEEFLDNFISFFGKVENKRILEIGCGEGHLSGRLKDLGAKVIGLEIGPQGKMAEINFGVEVVDKPLEEASFPHKFDAIISYGCLEHIIDINKFTSVCRGHLSENGVMFHSVPNTRNTIENLRFDELCHQHVNYFSPENIYPLFTQTTSQKLHVSRPKPEMRFT